MPATAPTLLDPDTARSTRNTRFALHAIATPTWLPDSSDIARNNRSCLADRMEFSGKSTSTHVRIGGGLYLAGPELHCGTGITLVLMPAARVEI
jgi:hypothetical protein